MGFVPADSESNGVDTLEGDLCGDVGDLTVELASEEEGERGSSAASSGPRVVRRGSAARLEGLRLCEDMTKDLAGLD